MKSSEALLAGPTTGWSRAAAARGLSPISSSTSRSTSRSVSPISGSRPESTP